MSQTVILLPKDGRSAPFPKIFISHFRYTYRFDNMEEGQAYQQQPQQTPPQQGPYQQQQPQYQQISRSRDRSTIASIAPYLIMIGAVLIGIGIIVIGFAPGNISIHEPEFGDDTVDVEMTITPVTVGAILAGIGAIFSGVGGGLNVKAYWDKQAKDSEQDQGRPPSRGF